MIILVFMFLVAIIALAPFFHESFEDDEEEHLLEDSILHDDVEWD